MAVLGFDEALEMVREKAQETWNRQGKERLRTESLSLLDSAGRVLAEPVKAERDQPPFNRVTRDGYAVRVEDLAGSGGQLRVIGQVRAGDVWGGPAVGRGEAISIMTGAPLPPGTDAVVMVEHVERRSDSELVQLRPGTVLVAGDHVVPQGAEAAKGEAVLEAGTPLGAAELALLASCGAAAIPVYSRPLVAILATGDELVEIDAVPADWQIRNSNSYALAALAGAAGARAERLPTARDLQEEIRDGIATGSTGDLLLLSGGVSMGEFDLVERVLAEAGAEFFFTGVRMQPGKPLVFGRLPGGKGANLGAECLFFGLPGNPVSTQVTFHCFAEPLLRMLRGEAWTGPRFTQATLAEDVVGRPALTRLLPARLWPNRARPEIRLVPWVGSGDLRANSGANCYALFPEGQERFVAGDVVTVLLR